MSNNEKVNVEVQLIERKNFAERLLYYFSKLYSAQIRRGDKYTEAKRVILIAIIDYPFNLTKGIEEMETTWKLFEEKHKNLVLTNYLEIHILEIEKVKNTYLKNKKNEKAQWMLFLDDPNSEEVQEIMKNNKEIKEATVVVREMSEDEKMQRLAHLREKARLDEKAIYEAGEARKAAEIAKKMIDVGIPFEKIAECTSLTIKEIQELANQ